MSANISTFSLFTSQLGQHYLIIAEERDTELNNSLAVRWLLKAAKQGRRGAARLLQRCWIQNKGLCVCVCVCVSLREKSCTWTGILLYTPRYSMDNWKYLRVCQLLRRLEYSWIRCQKMCCFLLIVWEGTLGKRKFRIPYIPMKH
jgi:TPR repeat protein